MHAEMVQEVRSWVVPDLIYLEPADPDFDKALACTFLFEKPQRLKAVVLSRSKKNGGDSSLGRSHHIRWPMHQPWVVQEEEQRT
jgi:hypothetical protein